jgi:hypothetical protein
MTLLRGYLLTERAIDRYEIVEAMLDMNNECGLQLRVSGVQLGSHVIVNFDFEGDFECLVWKNDSLGKG